MKNTPEQLETPSGFLKHAQEFLEAAELVFKSRREVSLPGYFLLGRSLELSLKAYLLKSGHSINELRSRKFGHNLHALLRSAVNEELTAHITLSQCEFSSIQLLSQDYMEKRLEYRESGQLYHLPYVDVVSRTAGNLIYGLENYCGLSDSN